MQSVTPPNTQSVRRLLGLGLCLLLALVLHFTQTGEKLSRKVLDWQFTLLQRSDVRPLPLDVVIIGIDPAAFKSLREPIELWHPHLGKLLLAMAEAKPAVLGLDIVLPQRSYDFLALRYDQPLLQGLQAVRARSGLVLAQQQDDDGLPRPVFQPYLDIAGMDAPASVELCPDGDGVVRRFDPNRCTVNTRGSTLVEKMAAHLGRKDPGTGLVDFGIGKPFEYVPLMQVLAWQAAGNSAELKRNFSGRPVLLGVVTDYDGRVAAPVPLAAWEPSAHLVHPVLIHAQTLRSILGNGLIKEVNVSIVLLLTLAAAAFWLGRTGWVKLILLAAMPFLLLPLSASLLGRGWYLPVGGILFAGVFAFLARLAYDHMLQTAQRKWLRSVFGNFVAGDVLQEIVAGNIDSSLEGARSRVCILYAGIDDFNERSEGRPAPEVVALLNVYFSEMSVAIQQHKGVVDKFIGDGILAFFGAPQKLECPEKNALEAAQEMLWRLRQVNARLQEQNIAPIGIGIALHVGEVVIGHVGSNARREYTIIGDAVNIAAQLGTLRNDLDYPVLCTAVVANAVENSASLDDCGERVVAGGTFHIYGWNPPLLAAK